MCQESHYGSQAKFCNDFLIKVLFEFSSEMSALIMCNSTLELTNRLSLILNQSDLKGDFNHNLNH